MINKYIKVLGIYIKPELILDIILIHLNIFNLFYIHILYWISILCVFIIYIIINK